MIIFSSPLLFSSRVMSNSPGVSSPELQATLYERKFFGNSSLNCKAIPLPITPTVLTVFTRASALEVIILPLVKCIMERSIFVLCLHILGYLSQFAVEWLSLVLLVLL